MPLPTLNGCIVAGNYNGATATTADNSIRRLDSTASADNADSVGGRGGLTDTNGNQVGVALAEPDFDPNGLQNNGGPTETIALEPGSVALNAGITHTTAATDQRGTPLSAGHAQLRRRLPGTSVRHPFLGSGGQPAEPALEHGSRRRLQHQRQRPGRLRPARRRTLQGRHGREPLASPTSASAPTLASTPGPRPSASPPWFCVRRIPNDVNNCYFAALLPGGGGLDQIVIEKVVNGHFTGLAAKALPAGTTTGTLSFQAFGDTLTAYLNGQLEATTTDSTFTRRATSASAPRTSGPTFANFVAPAWRRRRCRSATTSPDRPALRWAIPGTSMRRCRRPLLRVRAAASGSTPSTRPVADRRPQRGVALRGEPHNSTTVSATVVNAGSGAGVVANWNSATQSGYELLLSGSSLQLYTVVNGVATPLGTANSLGGERYGRAAGERGHALGVLQRSFLIFSLNDTTFTRARRVWRPTAPGRPSPASPSAVRRTGCSPRAGTVVARFVGFVTYQPIDSSSLPCYALLSVIVNICVEPLRDSFGSRPRPSSLNANCLGINAGALQSIFLRPAATERTPRSFRRHWASMSLSKLPTASHLPRSASKRYATDRNWRTIWSLRETCPCLFGLPAGKRSWRQTTRLPTLDGSPGRSP